MPRKPLPMHITLSPERRAALIDTLRAYFTAEFDEDLSVFRAEGLVDLLIAELGPPVYNQGVRDASAYVTDKLRDIEGEVFEPETPA